MSVMLQERPFLTHTPDPTPASQPVAPKPAMPDFAKLENIRRYKLLQAFCLVMMGNSFSSFILFFIIWEISSSFLMLLLWGICLVDFLGYIYAYQQVRRFKLYRVVAWQVVSAAYIPIAGACLLLKTSLPSAAVFILPITMAVVLFQKGRPVILVTVSSCVITCLAYLLQNLLKVYNPPFTLDQNLEAAYSLIAVLVILIPCAAMFYLPVKSQLRTLDERANLLQTALNELTAVQQTGQQVSQEILGLVAQLNSTASQQANGSQEQVATTSQVNSSLGELSSTAEQIAHVASRVDQATATMTASSRQIESTTAASAAQVQEGLSAVKHTVVLSQSVAELYRQLVDKIGELDLRSQRMRRVLDVLGNIAEETHLLSLNAAIEAAGAGQHGERFAVVAQQVKNLARNSKASNQEVISIIGELQVFSNELSELASYGNQQAGSLEAAAHQTGQTIERLQEIARQAQQQAQLITEHASDVKKLSGLIHLTTHQQSSASQEILSALSELVVVARQSAEGSNVIALSAAQLETLSQNLNSTLETAIHNA